MVELYKKAIINGLVICMLMACIFKVRAQQVERPDHYLQGFIHPGVIVDPGAEYGPETRNYQGIPGIERTPGGRIWATWYVGKVWEERFNYSVLATSGDDGETWGDISYVIDPDGDGPLRAADPCLWLDPEGKLWCFWWLNEKVWSGYDDSKISVTLAMTTTNPEAESPVWSDPFPVFPGLMLNKPIVTSRGEWLAPSNKWFTDNGLRVMASNDKGKTWTLRGMANVPPDQRNADEPMIVERSDGSLWMLVRTKYGIGETISTDHGSTWTEVSNYQAHTVSRFHLRKLHSGNLLLIRHGAIDEKGEREHLTAYLSDDDGASWKGGLMLDERRRTSYPDAIQAEDGTIYAIYDYNRHLEKHILMATFTEEDIMAKAFVSPAARSKVLVNQAFGDNPVVGRIDDAPPLTADLEAAKLITDKQTPEFRVRRGDVRPLYRTDDAFTDSDYIFRLLPDDPFFRRDRKFVISSINRTRVVCTSPGMVYVFTPAAGRNPDSVEGELLKLGFVKTTTPEFDLLFKVTEKVRNSNACSVYQKQARKGEKITFGRWGVLVF